MLVASQVLTHLFKNHFKEFNDIIALNNLDFMVIETDEAGREYISKWLHPILEVPSYKDLKAVTFEDFEKMSKYASYVRRIPGVKVEEVKVEEVKVEEVKVEEVKDEVNDLAKEFGVKVVTI